MTRVHCLLADSANTAVASCTCLTASGFVANPALAIVVVVPLEARLSQLPVQHHFAESL